MPKKRHRILVPSSFTSSSKPVPRSEDSSSKPQLSVNQRLSLLRKFNKRAQEPDPAVIYGNGNAGGPEPEDSIVVVPKRRAAGPVPKGWAESDLKSQTRRELKLLAARHETANGAQSKVPLLRQICCRYLAGRLREFAATTDTVRLFFCLPSHLRDEIRLAAPSKTVITDRMLKALWTGEQPSRILDLSGANITVPALRKILPRPIKARTRRTFGDEEDDTRIANEGDGDPENWEEVMESSSSEGWSDDGEDFELPERLEELPRTLDVSFCNLDPMSLAHTLTSQLPLLTTLNISGALRGQFAGAAFLSICKGLLTLRHLDASASAWLKQEIAEEAATALVTTRLETFAALLCPLTDGPKVTALLLSRYPLCSVVL